MASRRYNTCTRTEKVSYKEESSSDDEYEPSGDEYQPSKSKIEYFSPPPASQTIKYEPRTFHEDALSSSYSPNLIPSPPSQHSESDLAKYQPARSASQIPSFSIPTGTPIGAPTFCPHCMTRRTSPSTSPSTSTTYKCPNECGWGHYDDQCGMKIPLVPNKQTTRKDLPAYSSKFEEKSESNVKYEFYAAYDGLVGNDSGYVTGDDVDEGDEDGFQDVEDGKEETFLMFAWDRFKTAGKIGGRNFRVDGEGDTVMGGV